MTSVSFQGERGAYSQAAALSFFGETVETVALPTFTDVISNTEYTKTEYCILPVENSLEGSIGESYDLLLSTKLNVVGEIYHRIKHCLIGLDTLDKIDEVYSHPQALGQCRKLITGKSFHVTLDTPIDGLKIPGLDFKEELTIQFFVLEEGDVKIEIQNTGDSPLELKGTIRALNDPILFTYHLLVITSGVIIIGFSAAFSIRKPRGF